MAVLIDSYSESNQSYSVALSSVNRRNGQSFAVTTSGILNKAILPLATVGSPTGNIYVMIYAHSGTYGSSSVPTGSPLATSDVVDVSTLSEFPTFESVEFIFSGVEKISLSENTKYCLVLYFPSGTDTKRVHHGADNSTPSHGGNYFYSANNGTSWTSYADYDLCFYVYGVENLETPTIGESYPLPPFGRA